MNAADKPRSAQTEKRALSRQRLMLLHNLENWLEMPMTVLSAVWLYLMVVELVWGLNRFGEVATTLIWIVFIVDFLLRLFLAPEKVRYLRRNWLTAIALLLPALRMFRIVRAFRALARLRGLQLVRVLGSVNRSMKSLGNTLQRRGFGYVAGLTIIVLFAGAAGMFFFEKDAQRGAGFDDYWTALWWTAMILTTMGTEAWPKTPEGRALCLLLAIYAFSVFGYFTGIVATYFIGRDAETNKSELATRQDLYALRREMALLRKSITDGQVKGEE